MEVTAQWSVHKVGVFCIFLFKFLSIAQDIYISITQYLTLCYFESNMKPEEKHPDVHNEYTPVIGVNIFSIFSPNIQSCNSIFLSLFQRNSDQKLELKICFMSFVGFISLQPVFIDIKMWLLRTKFLLKLKYILMVN